KKMGYNNVRVYLDGEPAWVKADLPNYSSHEFVKNGNIILIDTRFSDEVVHGRIKRAVNIPFKRLEGRIDDIPRKAPIVLYGDEEALEAFKEFRDSGFKHVSLVEGGYDGWVKAGGEIVSGRGISNEIFWQRILGKGEVSLEEFRKAAAGEDREAVIIDARTRQEVTELGMFRNAINIPLEEIADRLSEIPKDKKIYLHCSTGTRADQAYKELINHGYNAKYLFLDISDPACDCEIIKS
ncbi:MAG: rhodanese, partial [Deltaproteobacteria bacterium]|nr:rhodanese [Deltaproteobacteria bacterium]